ncbi:MAG: magnesium transporter [Betaproteobacteria bacterium TMED156]|nr:MAG: magnesium transporter [Betaproteobacteria bacterium TMED156]
MRDPEVGKKVLFEIQELLSRFSLESQLIDSENLVFDKERKLTVKGAVANQQTSTLLSKLNELHAADIAYILEALPMPERELIWKQVNITSKSHVLIEISGPVRPSLTNWMNKNELIHIAQSLDPDDLAYIADDLPYEIVEKVRDGFSISEKEQFRTVMSYSSSSVGAYMDFEVITIREDINLEVVHRYLRRLDGFPPHTNKLFVTNRKGILTGSLSLENLLIKNPETVVKEIMEVDILALNVKDDAEEVAKAFEKYDLVSAPVVDDSMRLVGRLTVAEIVDFIMEENSQETFTNAGFKVEEDVFASVFTAVKNRWMWLAINLLTAFFASRVIGVFEGTIERVVALATLMPIIAGVAGNSGNQTLVLMIRSIALGHITSLSISRLFIKELSVAFINGIIWGAVAGLFAYWLYFDQPISMLLGLTMMLAILLNLTVAAAFGVLIPVILNKLNKDPAVGSSVLLTFGTDSMGFLIFLGLATMIF